MSPKRVLFLYISMSSGHQRAADATREALSLIAPQWQTAGIDAFSYAYPIIGKLIARTYLEVLRRTPILWDYLYDNPDVEAATREFRELLNVISSPKMKTLLEQYNPQALVCTQAVPCSFFAAEKRKGHLSIPLIAVITDFAIHSYWVYKEVDLYCVSSEDSRKDLIRHGIDASRIVVTGIPISPTFLTHGSKEQARSQLHLDPDRATLLLMGGSQGLGPFEEVLSAIRAQGVQCLVATGLNRDLYRSLRKRFSRDRRVRVFGYTRSVNTFMDAADILITKPGGLTSSEALAKGLPLIISNSIPGQEERNARYLLKKGVAERADTPEELAALLQSLLNHPARLRRMAERATASATPNAAVEVARWIFRLANDSESPSGKRSDFWGAHREYDKIPRVS